MLMRRLHLPTQLAGQRSLFAWLAAGSLALAVFLVRPAGKPEIIESFQACREAGYVVTQSNPPVCHGPGKSFTGPPLDAETLQPVVASLGMTTLVDGDTAGNYPKAQLVIANQAEWEKFWHDVHAGLSETPPLLPVDFTKHQVVAVTTGRLPTDGYTLRVTSISAGINGSTVNLVQGYPTTVCPVQTTPSNRYLIVQVDKLTAPVSFHISDEARPCVP